MIDYGRLFASFCSGAMLAMAGSLIQIVTANELASPATLGFQALVVLVVIIVHFAGLVAGNIFGLEFTSLAISLVLFSFFIFIPRRRQEFLSNSLQQNTSRFILLGLCFNLFVGAVFSLLQFLLMGLNWDFPSLLWFGNFRFVSTQHTLIVVGAFLISYGLSWALGARLRTLSFGHDWAQGMGVDAGRTQRTALLVALFSTMVVTSLFGVFAFMGLIFPHLLRFIPTFRYDAEKELRYGPWICAFLFMMLDYLCWSHPFYGVELPVGMVSSVLGSFLFILLLLRKQEMIR